MTALNDTDLNRLAFAARLREAMEGESARSLAGRVGIAPATVNQYLSGRSEPTRPILNGIASALNVSLEWLANGNGQKQPAPHQGTAATATPSPLLDEILMGKLVEGIATAYKELGQGLAPMNLGQLAARLHNEITADTDGPEDYPGAIKARLGQLRRELQAAAGGTFSGKRSA